MLMRIIVLLNFMVLFMVGCVSKNTNIGNPEKLNTEPPKINIYQEQLNPPLKGDSIAIMKTDMGDIKIKLFPKEAPKSVENFTKLAEKGYYDGLIFHRVIKDFMIQGGDPDGTGMGGNSIWGESFEDEFSEKLHNYKGALSMANSGPNTNGSQFFIVQLGTTDDKMKDYMKSELKFHDELIDTYAKNGGTPWLDNKHTVFGQVFEGMDIVDRIASVEVGQNDKPKNDIKIIEIQITKQK